MKNTRFIVFLFIALGYNRMLIAQVFSCNCGQVRLSKVTAPSGLVLREQPSKSSKKILAIPLDEVVTVCEVYYPAPVQENIEGIGWGQWVRVMYQGKEGYVFDFYLDKNPMIEILHADFNEPPAFWPKPIVAVSTEMSTNYGYHQLWMKTVELIRRESFHGDVWFDVDDKMREKAKFFICGIPSKPYSIQGYISEYHGKDELLPGTYTEIDFGKQIYAIYATGQVMVDKAQTPGIAGEGPYLLIRDYKLFYTEIGSSNKPQLLAQKAELVLNKPERGSAILALDFAGDLDGDGLPDLLLNESDSYGSSTLLFLSSKAESGFLLKLVRKVFQACC